MRFNGPSLFFASEKLGCVFGAEGEVKGSRKRSVGVKELYTMFVSHFELEFEGI